MTMKKWLNISFFVLVAVAVVIVFYNKQRQYERLNTKCNELKANYKKLLIEKFEPPSFRKTVTEEKKKRNSGSFS